jgi:HSP20 family protein
METALSKWNPFKFLRKSAGEGRGEPSPGMLARNGNASANWLGMPLPFLPDPVRLMQDLVRDPFDGAAPLDRWFGDYSPGAFNPRVDVVDDGDAMRITAELPGMEKQDVEIDVEDDVLVLRGEKTLESKSEEQGCYHVERAFGSFRRVIPLPKGVDVGAAEAKMKKGVLTVRLPKSATAQSAVRQIKVN